jgi:hypothetical protein
MRQLFLLTAAAAIVSVSSLFVSQANAMTVGTVPGIQNGRAQTSAIEPVVRVCRHRFRTSRRYCYIDRSRPPTVCHHLRRTSRLDCY